MSKIIVRGGQRLSGNVRVSGAKNAVLPILAATLLANKGECIIHDVPFLDDVITIQKVLAALGGKLTYENETMRISAQQLTSFEAPYELVRKMRASFLCSWDRCLPVWAEQEFHCQAAVQSELVRLISISKASKPWVLRLYWAKGL